MRHVVTPDVQLVADALVGEPAGELAGTRQRSGWVYLPGALADDEQQRDSVPQPVEVVAVQVGHVVHRVVEIGGVAAFTPGMPGRRVVVAGEAHRERKQVGTLEGEVRRVVGAQAAAEGDDLADAAGVVADPRDDVLDDPRLVTAVPPGAFFDGHGAVRPTSRVEAVDAVQLDPAGVDQTGHGADHAVVLEVPGTTLLGREDERRPAVMAVRDYGPTQLGPAELDLLTPHRQPPAG